MTLEDLLYKIGETAIKNKIINFSAVGGDVYDLNVENIKDYPVLFASPTGTHQVRENTTEYEVTFYFLDRLLSDDVNDVQIFSTAIEQLKLILTMVENIKGVLDVTDDYEIQNFTETERMNDRVAGAFATVKIMIQNMSGCCDTEFVTLMLKLENKTLNVTKNGKYTVTYNKMYDGLRKVEVDVNVDVETPYQDGFADGKEEGLEQGYVSGKQDGIAEGAEVGKELAAQDAIVLNVTENGTYYTKYADIPEWTKPETGDDFYSYAKMTGLIGTGINNDTVNTLELWWMFDENTSVYTTIFDCKEPFGFKLSYNNNSELQLYFNGVYQYINVLPNVWYHLIFEPGIGIWCNDVFYELSNNIGATSEVVLGGTLGPSYFGMVKINDTVFIPTGYGFTNLNTSKLFPKPSIYEFYNNVKPTVVPELIKQVDVDAKVNVSDNMLKLSYSSFKTIPSAFDFSNIYDLKNMFSYCTNLENIESLSDLDVSNVSDMSYCFKSCNMIKSYLPLANWDTSNVTKMQYMFDDNYVESLAGLEDWDISKVNNISNMFSASKKITNIDELANWDTSNVTDISNLFKTCSKLVNANGMSNWDTSKVTTMDSMFHDCTSLTTVPAIDCSNVSYDKYPLTAFINNTTLTTVGGFINAKARWNGNYGLAKFAGLTRESCINILNGLFDFTTAGITPDSYQGKLKVHANFLTAVGDDISIGINKGWQITT